MLTFLLSVRYLSIITLHPNTQYLGVYEAKEDAAAAYHAAIRYLHPLREATNGPDEAKAAFKRARQIASEAVLQKRSAK